MITAPRANARASSPEIERRRTRRLHVQLPAAVFLRGSPRFVPFVVRDLSLSGAYLSSEVPIGTGERFVLSIRPPGTDSPIVAQARVVRIEGQDAARNPEDGGVGVVFTGMSEESYTALAGYWYSARYARRDDAT